MRFEYKYTLNDNDYFEFNKFHLENHPSNKRTIGILRFLVPALLAIVIVISVFTYDELFVLIIEIVVYVAVGVAWFFLVKPLFIFILKRNIKSMKKHGKLPYGKETLTVFEDDYIIETTPEAETKFSYSTIERIAIGGNAIYLYLNAAQAIIIPLYVFMPFAEKDEFLNFIYSKTPQAKR